MVKLGTRVRYDARDVLWRAHLAGGKREWRRVQFGSKDNAREGVIVGERVLANGEVIWGGWDELTTFHPKEYIKAYLVAFDMRRKPVYVLPEDLEELD